MYSRQYICSVVVFILFEAVLNKEICDIDDADCTTKAEQNIYKSLVSGIEGVVDPIDPLHVDKLNGTFGIIKFEMTDVSLTGMKNCEVVLSKCNSTDKTYKYHLQCPQLIFMYNYHDKGDLEEQYIHIEGSAVCSVGNYSLVFTGEYTTFTSEKDQKSHITFKDYNLESDFKGQVDIEIKNSTLGSTFELDTVMDYLYSNYSEIRRVLQSPFLESLMTIFTNRLDTCQRKYAIDEIFLKN